MPEVIGITQADGQVRVTVEATFAEWKALAEGDAITENYQRIISVLRKAFSIGHTPLIDQQDDYQDWHTIAQEILDSEEEALRRNPAVTHMLDSMAEKGPNHEDE
jgi:hypothetical protein